MTTRHGVICEVRVGNIGRHLIQAFDGCAMASPGGALVASCRSLRRTVALRRRRCDGLRHVSAFHNFAPSRMERCKRVNKGVVLISSGTGDSKVANRLATRASVASNMTAAAVGHGHVPLGVVTKCRRNRHRREWARDAAFQRDTLSRRVPPIPRRSLRKSWPRTRVIHRRSQACPHRALVGSNNHQQLATLKARIEFLRTTTGLPRHSSDAHTAPYTIAVSTLDHCLTNVTLAVPARALVHESLCPTTRQRLLTLLPGYESRPSAASAGRKISVDPNSGACVQL